jgi:hypothetical protein
LNKISSTPFCPTLLSIRVARFFLVHDSKTGQNVSNAHYINVPNGHKISQMYV